MSSVLAERMLYVEMAADHGKDPIVAYSDTVLDNATRLAVSRVSGKISAETFIEGQRVVFRCGRVSMEQVARLEDRSTILWTRLEGENVIAAAEISLELI
jgi:hypothetical protein